MKAGNRPRRLCPRAGRNLHFTSGKQLRQQPNTIGTTRHERQKRLRPRAFSFRKSLLNRNGAMHQRPRRLQLPPNTPMTEASLDRHRCQNADIPPTTRHPL